MEILLLIILRKHITDFNYSKYVKKPVYFCHLDWWYAKDAFFSLKSFRPKYGVEGKTIMSMFNGKNVN